MVVKLVVIRFDGGYCLNNLPSYTPCHSLSRTKPLPALLIWYPGRNSNCKLKPRVAIWKAPIQDRSSKNAVLSGASGIASDSLTFVGHAVTTPKRFPKEAGKKATGGVVMCVRVYVRVCVSPSLPAIEGDASPIQQLRRRPCRRKKISLNYLPSFLYPTCKYPFGYWYLGR